VERDPRRRLGPADGRSPGGAAINDRHHSGPSQEAELAEQDLAIAALVGRHIERREHHETPRVHDLLAVAAEFGETAVDVLCTVLACYEAMRAYDTAP
jgi:hypothetical protein